MPEPPPSTPAMAAEMPWPYRPGGDRARPYHKPGAPRAAALAEARPPALASGSSQRIVSREAIMPKRSAVWSASFAVAGLVVAGAARAAETGSVPIFNGRDLSGWKVPDGDNGHWKVVDGVIDYDAASEATGDKSLWTEKEYGDFVLRLDWRIKETPYVNPNVPIILPGRQPQEGRRRQGDQAPGARLGFGRLPARRRASRRSTSGAGRSARARSTATGWTRSMPAAVRAGVTPRARTPTSDVGEWNTLRDHDEGRPPHGRAQRRARCSRTRELPGVPAKGPIALQHHGDKKDGVWTSPPALVQFRNISVQELK